MGLAAPMVQVVAARRLFQEGVYLRSGDALERIAGVDHVVFDKTGTLTLGDPALLPGSYDAASLQAAAQLARASRHPFSRAVARAAGPGVVAGDVEEHPGLGVSGVVGGRRARLGAPRFAGASGETGSALWFCFEGDAPVAFHFEDAIRDDARETIQKLRRMGLCVELLSGDSGERVEHAAKTAGIELWTAHATPQSKAARLDDLRRQGRKVLMVGDGLNDAGALATAHASLAPGGAVDVSSLAADCVYSGSRLSSIVRIIEIAREARKRMRENFTFAAIYNVFAIPVALAGWATPLVAAVAMSSSSAIVSLNALRMSGSRSRAGAAP
jgi:Cu2+-exporting ATPase